MIVSLNKDKGSKRRSILTLISIIILSIILVSPGTVYSQAGSGSDEKKIVNETDDVISTEQGSESKKEDSVSEEPGGMRLPFFLLLMLGVGIFFGALTLLGSIGAIFYPWLQSAPDLTKVVVKNGKKGKKNKKILIAYQTKNGGSAKIGIRMWEILTKKGYFVDMKHIPDILDDDISDYDAFIIGGAIYWSMFLRTTREFIAKNADLFSKKPTALYMACGKMINEFATRLEGDEAKWSRLSKVYLEPMLNEIPQFKPVDIGTFAGDIFIHMMNLPEFIMMGVLWFKNGNKFGAYIDLDRVSKWTEQVIKKLKI